MSKTIVIDPGHGGFDAGASFEERKEKDDALRLALAVGRDLESIGYTIYYTRTDDRYDSPYDKAQIANNADAELFVSFHRNFAEQTNLYEGVQALIYDNNPLARSVAENVNKNLANLGFRNVGIESRKELVVLRRTKMPAVLLEVGFINNTKDNELFDSRFSEIVTAISKGIQTAYPLTDTSAMQKKEGDTPSQSVTNWKAPNFDTPSTNWKTPNFDTPSTDGNITNFDTPSTDGNVTNFDTPSTNWTNQEFSYYVQVGLFRYPENAVYLMEQLKQQSYDTTWKRIGGLIGIWVGPTQTLDDAVTLQQQLQNLGYETLIVTEKKSYDSSSH